MKLKCYFQISLVLSCCFTITVTAQVPINRGFQLEILKRNKLALSDRILQLQSDKAKDATSELSLKSSLKQSGITSVMELVSTNTNFDVYRLPLDNMPCIVPNESFFRGMNAMRKNFIKSEGLSTNDPIPNPIKLREPIISTK